jgi:hypothetical protein
MEADDHLMNTGMVRPAATVNMLVGRSNQKETATHAFVA